MKYIWLIFAAGLISACDVGPKRISSAQLCEQTVYDYAKLRDDGPAEAYADLFTADGSFTLGQNVTRGREALIARHYSANKAALWRHHMLAVDISEEDGVLAGVSRFLIFTAPHPAPAKDPRQISGDYLDSFVIEGGRCKIKTRKVRIVFDS